MSLLDELREVLLDQLLRHDDRLLDELLRVQDLLLHEDLDLLLHELDLLQHLFLHECFEQHLFLWQHLIPCLKGSDVGKKGCMSAFD